MQFPRKNLRNKPNDLACRNGPTRRDSTSPAKNLQNEPNASRSISAKNVWNKANGLAYRERPQRRRGQSSECAELAERSQRPRPVGKRPDRSHSIGACEKSCRTKPTREVRRPQEKLAERTQREQFNISVNNVRNKANGQTSQKWKLCSPLAQYPPFQSSPFTLNPRSEAKPQRWNGSGPYPSDVTQEIRKPNPPGPFSGENLGRSGRLLGLLRVGKRLL